MEVQKAIEILEEYIELDRSCRETNDYSSDFDKFCEEKCLAMETVLNEINRLKNGAIG